jgi:hypothetical protein
MSPGEQLLVETIRISLAEAGEPYPEISWKADASGITTIDGRFDLALVARRILEVLELIKN